MEKFMVVTRSDLPLRDEDRKEIDKFKEDIKKSRPDRYNQDKNKKD